jgi:uncharacterized protein (TIGR00369 family)
VEAKPEAVAVAAPEVKAPNVCFGCGKANAAGMQLEFVRDEAAKKVIGDFLLDERYQGAPGMAHGGIVAVILDEALSKIAKFYGLVAVTGELNVEYLRPVKINHPIHVEAQNERIDGRQLYHVGEIRDAAGRVLARAKARFVVIDPERFRSAIQRAVRSDVRSGAEDGGRQNEPGGSK